MSWAISSPGYFDGVPFSYGLRRFDEFASIIIYNITMCMFDQFDQFTILGVIVKLRGDCNLFTP